MGPTCPFATCAEVRYDKDLGATFVKDKEITAVRLLIRVLQEEENEDTAQPDTTAGLRVTRRIMCAADQEDTTVYKLTVAGLSSGVQWLMRANAASTWMVLVSKRGEEEVFVASGYINVTDYPKPFFQKYVPAVYTKSNGSKVTMSAVDTPLKRMKLLDATMPKHEGHAFSERAAWNDVA